MCVLCVYIFDPKIDQKVIYGRDPPWPAAGAYSTLYHTPSWINERGGDGTEMEREGKEMGSEGRWTFEP